MKFLVVGDLHGQIPNLKLKDYDAVIAPGDFCNASKTINYMFKALKEQLKNPKSKKTWYQLIGKRKARRLINKSLADGRKVLEFLNNLGKPVYIVPGNHDFVKNPEAKWPFLREKHYQELKNDLKNLVDVHKRIVSVNGYQIIGHGLSSGPEYPQYTEDLARYSEKELINKKKKYTKWFNKIDDLFTKATKPVIFLTHNVPFNTKIDQINNPNSPRDGQHFGSLIAREIILKHQPLVCIGGHMHEHHAKVRLGSTVCINAGYGSSVSTMVELKNGQVRTRFYDAK